MGDQLQSRERLADQRLERGHLLQSGVVGLERLFDGRGDYLRFAVGFDRPAFAAGRLEGDDRADSYLGGFFQEPLEALDLLGRGDGEGQIVREFPVFAFDGADADRAAARVVLLDAAGEEVPPSVGDVEQVAPAQPQHPHAVFRLLFLQRVVGTGYVGGIKELHS